MTPELPIVLSVMVCDNVHQDGPTGKFFILGTFSHLAPPVYPATIGVLCAYAALTDGVGTTRVRLQIVDASEIDPEPLASLDENVTFADRFDVVELARMFTNVMFPKPGEYRLQFVVNGTLLVERRIVLVEPNL